MLLRYLDRYDGRRPDFSVGDEYELKTEVEKTVRLLEKAMGTPRPEREAEKLPYPEVAIHDYELDAFEIRRDKTFILRVMQGGVPYEYLIRRRSGNDKLIVFHNGAVPEGNVRYTASVLSARTKWTRTFSMSGRRIRTLRMWL